MNQRLHTKNYDRMDVTVELLRIFTDNQTPFINHITNSATQLRILLRKARVKKGLTCPDMDIKAITKNKNNNDNNNSYITKFN